MKWHKTSEESPPLGKRFLAAYLGEVDGYEYTVVSLSKKTGADRYHEWKSVFANLGYFEYWAHIDTPTEENIGPIDLPPSLMAGLRWKIAKENVRLTEELDKTCKTVRKPKGIK